MTNWFEIYPGQNETKIKFGDYPTKREIIEKLQNTGMISLDADINSYDIDADCSFIGIYNAKSGELIYKYEIE